MQAEFHAHDDEVDLEDFCAIMERHQPENLLVKDSCAGTDRGIDRLGDSRADGGGRGGRNGSNSNGGGGGGGKVVVTREEVVSNLVELFKEV